MEELKLGLIEGQGQFDWRLGANSPVVHTPLNSSGDWTDYLPEHEIQFNLDKLYDTLMCVSYSAANCLETLLMYYISKSLVPSEFVKWLQNNGYFKNGFINFSDRFIGVNGDINLRKNKVCLTLLLQKVEKDYIFTQLL